MGRSVTGLAVVGATMGEIDGMSVIGLWVGVSYTCTYFFKFWMMEKSILGCVVLVGSVSRCI